MNKKVKNAEVCRLGNIVFKSKLEKKFYVLMKEEGLKPYYEKTKVTIIEGFKPLHSFYTPVNSKDIKENRIKVRDTTYTPDFTLELPNHTVFIEAKGFFNDIYPYKEKLFRKWIDTTQHDKEIIFFRLHNVTQLKKAITIIKSLK